MRKEVDFAPYLNDVGNETFCVVIGKAAYVVTTHFSTDGKQSVLEQSKELLLEDALVPHN